MNGALAQQTHDPCTDAAALRARPAAELWRMWLRAGRALVLRPTRPLGVWRQRAWERRELARMSERELGDIGVSRLDALLEINKPFWRA